MTVKPAKVFGQGLEVICRYRAVGSFLRRYGKYAEEGQPLDAFVEVTIKDDDREDPPISEDALDMLGILSKDELNLKNLHKRSAMLLKKNLRKKESIYMTLNLNSVVSEKIKKSLLSMKFLVEICVHIKTETTSNPLELEKMFL